mgnify:FL=1
MTIKQFLEKQPLDSDTILRFQFTDRYDVGWNHNTAKSSLKDRLIENFSCDLQRSVFGLLCGLVGGLVFGLIVLDILKETGKFIVSEDGKLKFKRK